MDIPTELIQLIIEKSEEFSTQIRLTVLSKYTYTHTYPTKLCLWDEPCVMARTAPNLDKYTKLKQLDLKYFHKIIDISKLIHLKKFNTHMHMQLSDISTLTALEELYIDGCYNVTKIPSTRLRKLSMAYGCGVKYITPRESKMLVDLDISDNLNQTNFSHLMNLTRLIANNTIISTDELLLLTNLKKLSISGCRNYIEVNFLSNLTSLDISDNSNVFDISKLTGLIELNLSENLRVYSISTLTNLTKLDISDESKITCDEIKNLTKLISLKYDGNENITSLNTLSSLTHLSCRESSIPDSGISSLIKLREFDFRYSEKITDESVKLFTNLIEIDINHKLTANSISCLTNLEIIHIRNNMNLWASDLTKLKKLRDVYHTSHKIISAFPYRENWEDY